MTNEIAIRNQKLDLFTSKKNVDMEVVKQITSYMQNCKKIKITKPHGFSLRMYDFKSFSELNLDTLMFLYEHYSFRKPEISAYGTEIKIIARKQLAGTNFRIDMEIETEPIEINLLPNDIKKVIEMEN